MRSITSTQEFEQLLAEHPAVIIKFYTDWCIDCRRIEGSFADYAEANGDRASFAEINSEHAGEVADRFDVRGVPSLLVFQRGELVNRLYSRDAKTVRQVLDFTEQALQALAAGEAPHNP